jgi:hypothetical protein
VRLYVHALVDTPVMPWEEDDGRRVESIDIEGVSVVAERRDEAPPVSEAELQRQHAIVHRIAAAAPAVIPARFGALVDMVELTAILRQRRDLIMTTLDHVRDRVQMTLRIPSGAASAVEDGRASGREYLERRREQLMPPAPPHAERTLNELRGLIVDERRKLDRGVLSLYHLIALSDVGQYRDTVHQVGAPGIVLSGPFAPFAFTPDLL